MMIENDEVVISSRQSEGIQKVRESEGINAGYGN